ncbi:ribosomal L11 methyltransferase family protein [Clostridioides difficile DA00165]|nr:ribosomal L11 methyltransferase family protein [Clostridioides difficile DA00165]
MEFVEIIKQKVLGLKDFGIDIGEGSVSLDQVNEADWANAWKAYYKPTKVGQRVVVNLHGRLCYARFNHRA